MGNCCIKEEGNGNTGNHTLYPSPSRLNKIERFNNKLADTVISQINYKDQTEKTKNSSPTPKDAKTDHDDKHDKEDKNSSKLFTADIQTPPGIEATEVTPTVKPEPKENIKQSRSSKFIPGIKKHKHGVSTAGEFMSKESYIKEISNIVSDNLSLLQEKENIFPESESEKKAEKDDAFMILNNLNNFDITHNNSIDTKGTKGSHKTINHSVEVDRMNLIGNKLIQMQNFSDRNKANQSRNKNQSQINHKHSTSTVISNRNNTTFIRKTPKKLTPLPTQADKNIPIQSNTSNLQLSYTEKIDKENYLSNSNAEQLKHFEEMLSNNNFGLSNLSSFKRNKENNLKVLPSPHGGTTQSIRSGKKKISLKKYTYLFSDVNPKNQDESPVNKYKGGFNHYNTNTSKSKQLGEDLEEDFKKKYTTQNNSHYSNLFS